MRSIVTSGKSFLRGFPSSLAALALALGVSLISSGAHAQSAGSLPDEVAAERMKERVMSALPEKPTAKDYEEVIAALRIILAQAKHQVFYEEEHWLMKQYLAFWEKGLLNERNAKDWALPDFLGPNGKMLSASGKEIKISEDGAKTLVFDRLGQDKIMCADTLWGAKAWLEGKRKGYRKSDYLNSDLEGVRISSKSGESLWIPAQNIWEMSFNKIQELCARFAPDSDEAGNKFTWRFERTQ